MWNYFKRKRKSHGCDQFWLQSLRDENYVLLLMVCQREELHPRGILRSLKVVQGRPLNKNCKILLLQQSNPVCLYRLGTKWLSSNPAVRALQVMRDVKLNIDQQLTLYIQWIRWTTCWATYRGLWLADWRKLLSLYLRLARICLVCWV